MAGGGDGAAAAATAAPADPPQPHPQTQDNPQNKPTQRLLAPDSLEFLALMPPELDPTDRQGTPGGCLRRVARRPVDRADRLAPPPIASLQQWPAKLPGSRASST